MLILVLVIIIFLDLWLLVDKYVFSNYSPLIKFKDDNLYHVFKQRFADDINWVTKNRNNYGII